MGLSHGDGDIFLNVADGRFKRVFCGNALLRDGFLMVKSWWNAGERWSKNDLKSGREKHATFFGFIFAFCRFGELGTESLSSTSRAVMVEGKHLENRALNVIGC